MKQKIAPLNSISETLRSASVVSIGTLAGQLLAFFGSLALVRIFSPSEMGLFTTIVAIASFISPIASGRLASAIPLPSANSAGMKLARMSVVATMIFGVLAAPVIIILTYFIEDGDASQVWWWALPVLVSSLSIYTTANQLAVRFEKYGGLALRGVLYPLVMTGSQILLGLANFGSSGLIVGMAIGHLITALTLWLPISRQVAFTSNGDLSSGSLLRRYKHFPLFLAPAGATNAFAMQLPQIGVTFLFGLGVGGQFGMMVKILAVPLTLIGQSVGYVYAGQIAKSRREGVTDVTSLFDRLSLVLFGVGLIFLFGVVFAAEPVFTWLLGDTWQMSGQLAAVFAISTVAQLVSSPLSQTLVIAERVRLQFSLDIIRSLSMLATLVILHYGEVSTFPAVFAIACVSASGYVVLWLVNRFASKSI